MGEDGGSAPVQKFYICELLFGIPLKILPQVNLLEGFYLRSMSK